MTGGDGTNHRTDAKMQQATTERAVDPRLGFLDPSNSLNLVLRHSHDKLAYAPLNAQLIFFLLTDHYDLIRTQDHPPPRSLRRPHAASHHSLTYLSLALFELIFV